MDGTYTKFEAPGLSGVVAGTGSDGAFDPVPLLEMPDDGSAVRKCGNTVQAWIAGPRFVKRIRHRNICKAFRHLFEPPRPMIALRAAKRLAELGIPTPQVLAALRRSRHGLPQYDYLVTEALPASAVFADKLPLTEALAEKLTALLARLHGAGIEHGDASLRNFYRDETGTFGVIDLDACRVGPAPLPRRRRIRELARLASSFAKLAAERGMEDPPPDIAGFFAERYARLTGIEADPRVYRRRFSHLAERKR
ncbi:MAG: phosphotransferase [Lentisphaeria bacterium]|nr:phosphotransferase [Lentisphaeria bacterium]